jgi:hypothetical protein
MFIVIQLYFYKLAASQSHAARPVTADFFPSNTDPCELFKALLRRNIPGIYPEQRRNIPGIYMALPRLWVRGDKGKLTGIVC